MPDRGQMDDDNNTGPAGDTGSVDTTASIGGSTPTLPTNLDTLVTDAATQCQLALDNATVAIYANISQCFDDCKVASGSCEACIRGLIETQLNKVGHTITKCDSRIITNLIGSLETLAITGAGVGVLPPDVQLPPSGIMDVSSPGGSVTSSPPISGGSAVPTAPKTPAPPVSIIANELPECLPSDANQTYIFAWAEQFYGPDTIITLNPTATNSGVAYTAKDQYVSIPPLCGAPIGVGGSGGTAGPPTGTVSPPSGAVPQPSGSVSPPSGTVSPPSGTAPTIPPVIVIPTQPGTIIPIYPPSQGTGCPPTNIIVQCQPATYQYPTTPPQQPSQPIVTSPATATQCNPCQTASALSVDASVIDDPSNAGEWDNWLAGIPGGYKWRVKPTAKSPGLAVSQDGSSCLVVVWTLLPVAQSPTGPQSQLPSLPPLGGNYCSPDTIVQGWSDILAYADSLGGKGDDYITVAGALIGPIVAGAVEKITGIDEIPGLGTLTSILSPLAGMLSASSLRKQLTPGTSDANCKSDALLVASLDRAQVAAFGGWFGTVPEATIRDFDYKINSFCPNILPSQGELNSLVIGGWIDNNQWIIPTRMLGNCPDWQSKVVESAQSIPGINDAIGAARRGLVNQQEFNELLRRNGVANDRWAQVYYSLTDYIPGPGDLVTFMLRDVFDPEVVAKYQLDDEFDAKYQGQVTSWAKSQGMSDDTFKYYWRSHWKYASPGQIFDMVHRLRDVDRDPNDPFGQIQFTLDDARQALKVQDISPYFVDRLLAISYRPVSQRLIVNGIKGGEFNEDDIRRSFLDQGYQPAIANKLARSYVRVYKPQIAKANGLPAATDILKWYRKVTITRDKAHDLLVGSGYDDDQANNMLDVADAAVKAEQRAAALVAYKRRFMSGEFDNGVVVQQLIDAGLDVDRVSDVVNAWQIELAAKYKGPTVAVLCSWYGKGIINVDEYQRRIQNIGYDLIDAMRMINVCQIGVNEKRAKLLEAATAKAEANERRAIAQRKAAARDARTAAKQAEQDFLDALPCKPAKKPECPAPPPPTALPTERRR